MRLLEFRAATSSNQEVRCVPDRCGSATILRNAVSRDLSSRRYRWTSRSRRWPPAQPGLVRRLQLSWLWPPSIRQQAFRMRRKTYPGRMTERPNRHPWIIAFAILAGVAALVVTYLYFFNTNEAAILNAGGPSECVQWQDNYRDAYHPTFEEGGESTQDVVKKYRQRLLRERPEGCALPRG